MKSVLLVNYNNGSRWPVLPQNLLVLKQALQCEDVRVDIHDFNLTKQPYSVLERVNYDVIGLGFIAGYWQHQEAQRISFHINRNPFRNKFKFILGGHGPSAAPQYYKDKLTADSVFVGAADASVVSWLQSGCPDGIHPSMGYGLQPQSYAIENMGVYKRIKFPLTKENEFAIQILSGRGCPYKCAFCYRMDREFAQYSVDSLIASIDGLAEKHSIVHFQLSDELFMASKSYVETFCSMISDYQMETGYELAFDCNGRLNLCTPQLLCKMKEAGFKYINLGCEAMDNRVLAAMHKRQTTEDIIRGVEAVLEADLVPGLNFMFGNLHDSEGTLQKAVDFLIKYDTGHELRTIRPVTPYPGTALFNKLLEQGRLPKDHTVDYFYKVHVNSDLFSFHFMNGISNEQADKLLFYANMELYNHYVAKRQGQMGKTARDFYLHKSLPNSFRGWRSV